MPLMTENSHLPTPARLFKLCRQALGMEVSEIQDALCLMDKTTVLRIERGRIDVHGPTWVVLGFLLRDTDTGVESENAELDELANQVDEYCETIRRAAAARRQERDIRRGRGDVEDEETLGVG